MPVLFNENKKQKSGACKAGIMKRTKGEEYIRLFRNKRLTCSSALIKPTAGLSCAQKEARSPSEKNGKSHMAWD